jgi:hypothetical protein
LECVDGEEVEVEEVSVYEPTTDAQDVLAHPKIQVRKIVFFNFRCS